MQKQKDGIDDNGNAPYKEEPLVRRPEFGRRDANHHTRSENGQGAKEHLTDDQGSVQSNRKQVIVIGVVVVGSHGRGKEEGLLSVTTALSDVALMGA